MARSSARCSSTCSRTARGPRTLVGGLLGVVGQRDDSACGRAASRPPLGLVHPDPIQPGEELRLGPEAADRTPGAQERLLRDLLGLVGIRREAQDDGAETVGVDAHEPLERRSVTGLRCRDQRGLLRRSGLRVGGELLGMPVRAGQGEELRFARPGDEDGGTGDHMRLDPSLPGWFGFALGRSAGR